MRLGIDLGGSKIAGVALDPDGRERAARRVATPKHDYRATISAIRDLVGRLEHEVGGAASVGLGMPGSIVPATGLVQNANSTWLNGQPFAADLEAALARPVRLENDANCFALSESFDGAGAAAASVFGVIIGTGCGGGLVSGGRLISGPRAIGGEWGHNPLAWPDAGETPGERCWCGRYGCMETWVSGPGLVRDHVRHGGADLAVEEIARLAAGGDDAARKTLDRHASRLARGLAIIINIFDPEVIVLGGGLSGLGHLYDALPALVAPYVFADDPRADIRAPKWGDASGVRGAARLWDPAPGSPQLP